MTDERPSDDAESADGVRAALRAWVEESWDPELPLVAWRDRLAASGWACPGWPRRFGGRELAPSLAAAASEALAAAGVPGPPDGVALRLVAPTLLAHGTDALCARLLGPMATGRAPWCQLFSEPGAGSDLAGLATRAVRDGEEWVVSGQKVWSTGAATAELGLLLARTDPDVEKHAGISCFALPMRQPGVEVRPLRQMNDHQSFNEVFLDDARVRHDHLIGDAGDGWRVALTTLAHERRLAAERAPRWRRDPEGRTWREADEERLAAVDPHRWYPQRAGRTDRLVDLVKASGRASDPRLRDQVAEVVARALIARGTAQRAAAARATGRPPGPEGSVGKLDSSEIARAAARAHAAIAATTATVVGDEGTDTAMVAEILVSVPAQSIAGGTDEIQRTILAERILGLPKEPDPTKGLPFRELPRS